jgi:SET family sugar efflux transporter-like MFS transporter
LQVGVFSSAPAVGGILVSSLLGRRFDRRPTRLYAGAVAALGALGLVLLTVTRSFPLLVLIAATLLGAVAAAFPQLFALARLALGSGAAGRRSAPLLRSAWSLAWAVGPLVGSVLFAWAGVTTLLLVAAGVLGSVAVVLVAVPAPRVGSTGAPEEATPPGPGAPVAAPVALLTAGVVLFFTAMYAGSVALPLFVTRGLHQPPAAVGVLFSACAAVEVLAALALAGVPARLSQGALILGGMAAFVLYFGLTVLARGMALLLVGQVARGIAIGVVGAAGIRFFQDLLAPATGRATTLFSNAATAGSLVAGVIAGVAIEAVGYRGALVLCGAAALTAALAFGAGTVRAGLGSVG